MGCGRSDALVPNQLPCHGSRPVSECGVRYLSNNFAVQLVQCVFNNTGSIMGE
jgi:hypothetical protein